MDENSDFGMIKIFTLLTCFSWVVNYLFQMETLSKLSLVMVILMNAAAFLNYLKKLFTKNKSDEKDFN